MKNLAALAGALAAVEIMPRRSGAGPELDDTRAARKRLSARKKRRRAMQKASRKRNR